MHTQPHDLSRAQLEPVDLETGREDRDRRAVAQHRLDDLEADLRDAFDERLDCAVLAVFQNLDVVGRTQVSPRRLTGPTKPITNGFAGRS